MVLGSNLCLFGVGVEDGCVFFVFWGVNGGESWPCGRIPDFFLGEGQSWCSAAWSWVRIFEFLGQWWCSAWAWVRIF
jgi:hypothetical protein